MAIFKNVNGNIDNKLFRKLMENLAEANGQELIELNGQLSKDPRHAFPYLRTLRTKRRRPPSSERPSGKSYRLPLPVREILLLRNGFSSPVCPQCRLTLDREYQLYCDRCGQRLDWHTYGRAKIIPWSATFRKSS